LIEFAENKKRTSNITFITIKTVDDSARKSIQNKPYNERSNVKTADCSKVNFLFDDIVLIK
jgi:hypothetical protein